MQQQNSQGVIFLVTEDSACCDDTSVMLGDLPGTGVWHLESRGE